MKPQTCPKCPLICQCSNPAVETSTPAEEQPVAEPAVPPPDDPEKGTSHQGNSDHQEAEVPSNDSSTVDAGVSFQEDIQGMRVIDTDSIQKDDYVLSKYDCVTYLNIDDEDDEVEISYMTTHGKGTLVSFKWPRMPDNCWCSKSDIIGLVDEPEAGKQSFKLNKASLETFFEVRATDV